MRRAIALPIAPAEDDGEDVRHGNSPPGEKGKRVRSGPVIRFMPADHRP
jgi:hypothetical protein